VSTPHSADSRKHHNSHRGLLRQHETDSTGTSSLDAIVVPTARQVTNLRRAMTLAGKLNRPLVVLCSKLASVEDSVLLGKKIGVDVTAVDTTEVSDKIIPRFSTTELLSETEFKHGHDTGTKRNLALLLARLMGWRRIVFLDDDIKVEDPRDLLRAARLLDQYSAVGLGIRRFPDNSVVCHAHRDTGGAQRSFVGAGALAVDTTSISSFFPEIYNEDWFFLLNGEGISPVAVTGAARQKRYDPYADPSRASYEEFGDCLAEGVYWLLDTKKSIDAADKEFWTEYLRIRRAFIDDVASRVESATTSAAQKKRMVIALGAARARCEAISPELCVNYLQAWLADRDTWRRHVENKASESALTQPGAELDNVLSELNLFSSSWRTRT
jgi:hypothetical protein